MAFWLTLIGTVAFFVLLAIFATMHEKAPYRSKRETFFKTSGIASCVITGVLMVVALFMLVGVIITNSAIESPKAELKQQHDILVYQLENNLYDNDNDLGLKDLYDDISAYNSKVAKGKVMQRDFWWGIFYPNIYDDLELIDYKRGE